MKHTTGFHTVAGHSLFRATDEHREGRRRVTRGKEVDDVAPSRTLLLDDAIDEVSRDPALAVRGGEAYIGRIGTRIEAPVEIRAVAHTDHRMLPRCAPP